MTPSTKGSALTAAEADRLVAEALDLPGANEVLNSTQLSVLLGRSVIIEHLRVKPKHSIVVAHTDQHGEYGWTMLTSDPDKFGKARQRAVDSGQQFRIHRHESNGFLCSGSLWSDPELAKGLADARSALDEREGRTVEWKILRYNPRRRVVAMVDAGRHPKIARVVAGEVSTLLSTFSRWREWNVPVTHAVPLGSRGSATLAPLWGAGDLLHIPYEPAAESAGRALGRLHATPHPRTPRQAVCADPLRTAAALDVVAPWAAERARDLGNRCVQEFSRSQGFEATHIHGDFSPDQVILAAEDSHKIRVIDLERAGFGHPMQDIGSWLATCRQAERTELIAPFLAGYEACLRIHPGAANAWEAYSHLARAADFFRHRHPEWPAQTIRTLDLAEEALTQ